MIWIVAELTARQLLGQRRTLFLAAMALLPVLAAIIFQIAADDRSANAAEFAARVMFYGLIVTFLLPLTAVLLSTAAVGNEIEEGTIVYLLSKPVERWRIVAGKMLAAWGATAVIILASGALGGVIVLGSEGEWRILAGFLVALLVGSLTYSSLFMLFSVVTSRALILGVVYALIWEGLVTNFAPGVQRLSIREFTASVAEAVADTTPAVFEADLGLTYSLILIVVVVAVGAGLSVWRLSRFEMNDSP